MKVSRDKGFEELHAYQRARELTNRIYELTRDETFARDFGLVHQIRGASVSIMSNIAEGFERGTNAEFVQFLFIAKGSCGEVRAQVSVAFDQKYISVTDYNDLTDRCRRISGMLGNLINYLRQHRSSGRRNQKASPKSIAQRNHRPTEKRSLTLRPLIPFSLEPLIPLTDLNRGRCPSGAVAWRGHSWPS